MNYIERYWRDATPADAIKEPPMVARFWFEGAEDWEHDLLVGWDRTDECRWRSRLDSFEQCQVYDAPDPGEGWRLIDPDIDKLQEGDEFSFNSRNEWFTVAGDPRRGFCGRGFAEGYIYRRRIEQPKPEPKYVPFTWEDREQLRGRWIGSNDWRCERLVNVMHHDSGCLYANAINATSLCADWRFLDTGEPVGKRIDQ